MTKAIKVAIAALTAIICACGHGGTNDCFMWQQRDPDRPELGLHWALSYTKDVLCTCTKIMFGGMNPTPLPGSEDFFYPDDLLTLINNNNVTELHEKLGCKDSKAAVISTMSKVTTSPGSTSATEQLTTEATDTVKATTSQAISIASTSATAQLTTEAFWASWGSWGACSITCGGGTKNRNRTCVGSGACPGAGSSSESCNTESCLVVNSIGCKHGWKGYNDSCYFFDHAAAVTYFEANQSCYDMGSQLASIHSQGEQDFLGGIMSFA
ncbi:uncharacterized protein [Amphiura filiformis]|uniref:uncharacterized protein n=1 Tax=Amphiura filiformis TaxID=82378 RepID=UPI003B215C5B